MKVLHCGGVFVVLVGIIIFCLRLRKSTTGEQPSWTFRDSFSFLLRLPQATKSLVTSNSAQAPLTVGSVRSLSPGGVHCFSCFKFSGWMLSAVRNAWLSGGLRDERVSKFIRAVDEALPALLFLAAGWGPVYNVPPTLHLSRFSGNWGFKSISNLLTSFCATFQTDFPSAFPHWCDYVGSCR